MTKALFKKQMAETFSWLFMDRKTGKKRTQKNFLVYILLYLAVFGFLCVSFYNIANALGGALFAADLGWLYFSIMSLLGVLLGVFGSVFNTYSTLYLARDNDLLLSLPIEPAKILAVRLSGVYAMGLLYELIVMIPAIAVYFKYQKSGILSIIFCNLIPFVLSFFILTLSCVLGWVVALISKKTKNKSIITVIISLIFLFAYFYFYNKGYAMLERIAANPEIISVNEKGALYPLYQLGLAAQGNALSMLIFTAIIAVLFLAVYIVLSKSFTRLAGDAFSASKSKKEAKISKAQSADRALLSKEMRRFLGSSVYMLNCGLGIVLMLVGAVGIIIKADYLNEMIWGMFEEHEDFVPLLLFGIVSLISTMNCITAPSVSLEGKNIWIAQSLPVSTYQILRAKIRLHLLLTLIPVLILTACVEAVFKPDILSAILIFIGVITFIVFSALAGLSLNLRFPNLKWTNETVPVKQSMSVLLSLFGGWAVIGIIEIIYLAFAYIYIPSRAYLAIAELILAIISLVLYRFIKTKGCEIFKNL